MTYSNWKRLSAFVMTVVMVFSMLGTVGAVRSESTGLTYEKIDGSRVTADLTGNGKPIDGAETNAFLAEETVRAMVILEDRPVTLYGMEESMAREAQQEALTNAICENVLDGEELDVVWNLTTVTNAMAVRVPYGKLSQIRALDGVKLVYMEFPHEPLTASPDNVLAQNMTGALGVRNTTGITGAGTRVAVIDTGSDTDHQSLDNEAYLASLESLAAEKGLSLEKYMASLKLLDREKIAQVLPKLHAAKRYEGLTADDLYLNEKLPFNFNYVDGTLDVTHDHDDQGSHGSHVAGIAAANLLIPCDAEDLDFNGDGKLDDSDVTALRAYVQAPDSAELAHARYADLNGDNTITGADADRLEKLIQAGGNYTTGAAKAVAVTGVAPDAQLITMKVFGSTGGAYASDYIAALEDAVLLGCDVANLSLGGNFSGFTKEISAWFEESAWEEMNFINGVMDSLADNNTIACMAVGNNGNWADNDGGYGFMYTDEGGTFNASDPATFTNALAVASADNVGGVTTVKTVFGEGLEIAGNPSSSGVNASWDSLDRDDSEDGSTYDVVFLGDPSALFAGEEQTDETVYGGTEITEDLTGKVVLIARGNMVSFADKHMNAAAAGAAAVIVYNNESGVIYANLEGSDAEAPFWTITLDEAKAIYALGSGISMTVTTGLFVNENPDAEYISMSAFSSWGPTGALTIKPEITAPGGGIYSLDGVDASGQGYELMSGTSMASPHVAGLSALVKQYIRENKLVSKARIAGADVTERSLAQALMMSTAAPVIEEASGVEYSVRNQGAGLANLQALVDAQSLVLVDGQPDGKVKAELGDGNGEYSFTFTVYNLADEAREFALDASVLTTNTLEADGSYLVDDAMTTLDAETDLPESVSVPAKGSTQVTVQVKVSGEAAAEMEALGYTNGFYVEGFVYVTGKDTTHAIPMLGWYGNWGDPSMYDTGSYFDYTYDTLARPSHVVSNGYKNMLGWVPNGSDSIYPYDGNIFSYDGPDGAHYGDKAYNPDRNAFNNTEEAMYLPAAIFPTMIRNAEAFKLEARDHVTGEVYWEENNFEHYAGSPLYSSTFYPLAGQWMDVTTEYGLDLLTWDYRDNDGNLLPEGTQVDFVLTTAPEYYVHHSEDRQEVTVDWNVLGEGASLTFQSFRVDNTAPELAENPFTLNGNNLTVRAQDENYIASIVLLEGSGRTAFEFFYPDMMERGAVCAQTMDLTQYRRVYGEKAVVVLCDYAGNQSYYALNLGGEGTPYGEFVAFQYDVLSETGDTAWVSFDRDVDASETVMFASSEQFVCAEYVNGMIFAETEDGKLYGVSYEDMLNNKVDLEKAYLTTLENVYQDLAYNYQDGKLYGLYTYVDARDDNWPTTEIYSINIWDDSDEPLYAENWTLGRGGIYSLTMAIDDAGSIYVMADVPDEETYEIGTMAQLWKATCEYDDFWEEYSYGPMRFVAETGKEMDFLQSMTWDHNTESLYWSRFAPVGFFKVECELNRVDPVTGETTVEGYLSGETCGLMAPLTAETAAKEAHRNVPPVDRTQVARPVLRKDTVTLNLGSTLTLEYDLSPWYSSHKDVVWSSDNEEVATVDGSGTVTALRKGTAHITVAAKDDETLFDTCTINVSALNLKLEGTFGKMQAGVGLGIAGVSTYTYTMRRGEASFEKGPNLYIPEGREDLAGYGMQINGTTVGRDGYIWGSECGNVGMIYKIDPKTNEILEVWNPISGDMLFGMSYSEKTDVYTGIMDMYLFVDIPMKDAEQQHQEILASYDSVEHEFTWHRLNLLPYLKRMGNGFVTGEDGFGASSEIVLCGVTQIDNTDGTFYDNGYFDLDGNFTMDVSQYVPDTTLVLLDNVGRLWYVDEIMGMTKEFDPDFGSVNYMREDGSTIAENRDGVMSLDNGDGTYSVFQIRSIVETPLTDMFRSGTMPRITYTFSDIKYAGNTEEGDPIFFLSLYDYWNEGITNSFYLLIPGHETDEMDYETWEPIRTPDRLFELGNTGDYNIAATIYKATYIGGLDANEPEVYFVDADKSIANGTISVDKEYANAGETIRVTAQPDAYYQLAAGSLKANGEPIEGNAFVMPQEDVVITALFEVDIPARAAALCAQLEACYDALTEEEYTKKGAAALEDARTAALDAVSAAETAEAQDAALEAGLAAMKAVPNFKQEMENALEEANKAVLAASKYYAYVELMQIDLSDFNACQMAKAETVLAAARAAVDAAETVEAVDGAVAAAKEAVAEIAAQRCAAEEFSDVSLNDWFHEDADFMLNNGYMNGYPGGTFRPDVKVSRAQLVTILYRVAGEPEVEGAADFSDVAEDYYTNAVIWAAEQGITTGYPDGTFRPNAEVSRQELVTFLYRFAEAEAVEEDHLTQFPDAGKVADYAVESMNWAIANGIVSGAVRDNVLVIAPEDTARRDETCAIVARYMNAN